MATSRETNVQEYLLIQELMYKVTYPSSPPSNQQMLDILLRHTKEYK